MGETFQVKTRFLTAALVLLLSCTLHAAEEKPEDAASTILKSARLAQASQKMTLAGRLRTGPTSTPFRLVIDGPVIRYEFTDPSLILQLRLSEKSSVLQEIVRGKTEKVTSAKFDTPVRGGDMTYEDLSLRFLYWSDATLLGEEKRLTRNCWKVEAKPNGADSQYSKVILWIEEESGALLQAEAYGKDGTIKRRFTVRKVQKSEGVWLLKEMRVETMGGPVKKDQTPTYMQIDKVE